MSAQPNYLPDVREQYEQLPYPHRNPEDERSMLRATEADSLEYLTHFGFGGKLPLEGFQVLVAGGGTGDGSIFLSTQLQELGGRVIHLDLSEASIAIARKRAAIRKLDNIEFIHASLLDLPTMGIGPFDYITCSGVLHHLEDPDAGLKALTSVLKQDGLLKLMLYAPYGRTWIYHMQDILRRYNEGQGEKDIPTELEDCKAIMAMVKDTYWYQIMENFANDIRSQGDTGIYDLFLHSQDRAYSIDGLYDFVENGGLTLTRYIRHPGDMTLDSLPDSPIKANLLQRSERDQLAMLEKMNGTIKKHFCYAAYKETTLPDPMDKDMIPYFSNLKGDLRDGVIQQLFDLSNGQKLILKQDRRTIQIPVTDLRRDIVNYMNGKNTVADIQAKCKLSDDEWQKEWPAFFNALHSVEFVFLRHKDLPAFPSAKEMQARIHSPE